MVLSHLDCFTLFSNRRCLHVKKKATGYEEVKRLVDVYADDIPQMLDGAAHCKNHEWKRVN